MIDIPVEAGAEVPDDPCPDVRLPSKGIGRQKAYEIQHGHLTQ